MSLVRIYTGKKSNVDETAALSTDKTVYSLTMIMLALGSMVILYLFVTSLKLVVDVASTILFLFAPAIAFLNHRVMTNSRFPSDARPHRGLLALSAIGFIWMTAFSAYFLYLRFFA